jgi:hypothetical protein
MRLKLFKIIVLHQVNQMQKIKNTENQILGQRTRTHFYQTNLFSILPWTLQESSDSEDDLIFPLPSEQACSSDREDYVQDDGILDHETGLGPINEESEELTHVTNDLSKSGASTAIEDYQIKKQVS